MAGGRGFAAVQEIMAFRPTPILVLTDSPSSPAGFQALAMGALDVMVRPCGGAPPDELVRDLASRLKLLSGVRVITHVRGRRFRKRSGGAEEGPPVVGIGASLGGPRALAVLLKGLPRDLAAPICIVQHISQGFSHGLASWLSSESGLVVREAREGDALSAGAVLVAPTGAHLAVGDRGQVVLDCGAPVDGFRPSVTALFNSLAQRYGRRAVGVVLTGMGRDGAVGLSSIRAAGGRTLAQDEATSVVYGMPRAAVEVGAVERVVAIDEMAEAVVALVRAMGGA
jgi:two-component system chemotaxis response regulator CheB